MAKRLTDTDKWKKNWYRTMPPEYKCFWNFILDYSDFAGIWEVDFGTAQFYIGSLIDEEKIKSFFSKQILILNEGKRWFIVDFISFQYGKKLKVGHPFHEKIIERLKEFDLLSKYFIRDGNYFYLKNEGDTLFDTVSYTVSKSTTTPKTNRVYNTVSDTVSNNADEISFPSNLEEKQTLDRVSDTVCHTVKEKDIYIEKEKEEDKEEVKEKENKLEILDKKINDFVNKVSLYADKYDKQMLMDFIQYWTEHNEGSVKLRWEAEDFFNLGRRLSTWKQNMKKFKQNGNSKHTSTDLVSAAKRMWG